MNDNRVHTVFAWVMRFIPDLITMLEDPELTVDEILTGSSAALFNVYRSAYGEDADFTDFLVKLQRLADQHIRECKAGEDNDRP